MNKLTNMFDSHCHFEDKLFGDQKEPILSSLPQNGVAYIMNCCSDMDVVDDVLDIISRYDFAYGSLGVHPHWSCETPSGYLDTLREKLNHPKIVALGEIGLDYWWPDDRKTQMRVFVEQMDLAQQLKLPVIIHARNKWEGTYPDALDDTLPVLKQYKLPGIVHRYCGGPKDLQTILDLGMYISFNGDITYNQFNKNQLECIKVCPMDRILIETDAPYMCPSQVGTPDDLSNPTMLPYIVDVIARVRDMDPQEVCDITTNNAKNVYRIG